jgi:hypothetical protein
MTEIPQSMIMQSAPEEPMPSSRRRGRPLEMSPDDLLEIIRQLSRRGAGLFRVHRTHPGLYARARRLFGSWSGAVMAAGIDYSQVVTAAIERSVSNRQRRRRDARHGAGR